MDDRELIFSHRSNSFGGTNEISPTCFTDSSRISKKRPFSRNLNERRKTTLRINCNNVEAVNPWVESIHSQNTTTEVTAYFDNLESHLINMIEEHGEGKTVVGCIAWLSNKKIIAALAEYCANVLIVVNDEDYDKWGGGRTPEYYNFLPGFTCPLAMAFHHLDTPLVALESKEAEAAANLCVVHPSRYAPVRCFGNPMRSFHKSPPPQFSTTNSERTRDPLRKVKTMSTTHTSTYQNSNEPPRLYGGPLMHSKYLVFFDTDLCALGRNIWGIHENNDPSFSHNNNDDVSTDIVAKGLPIAVWTGSMNWTTRSVLNQENCVFIKNKKIAMGFFADFAQTFMYSKCLKSSRFPKQSNQHEKKHQNRKSKELKFYGRNGVRLKTSAANPNVVMRVCQ